MVAELQRAHKVYEKRGDGEIYMICPRHSFPQS